MKDENKLIVPKKYMTFFPGSNTRWIDPFNNLLEEYLEDRNANMSRNKLMQLLIEDGLKYRGIIESNQSETEISQHNPNVELRLSLEGFTSEQIDLLNSEQGKTIVSNLLRCVTGQGGQLPIFVNKETQINTESNEEDSSPVSQPEANTDTKARIKADFFATINKTSWSD